jgi:hypothetical protein
MTMMAPLASPVGSARYAEMGPSVVAISIIVAMAPAFHAFPEAKLRASLETVARQR